MPGAKAFVGGVFTSWLNDGPKRVAPNIVVNQALDSVLDSFFVGTTPPTAFYLAPFSGNVTPAATLTAATFASTLTEFTDYSESTRQVWTPGAVASQAVDNSASVATFTVSVAGGTVWGFGMLTASAKSATTGLCVAATKDAESRTGLAIGDTLNVNYGFAASDV
ncbi:MAG: hypothetical protein L0H83_11830 [Salinisphaera sp.]|nr:hypothetical protein [Salinisphaera sp.]